REREIDEAISHWCAAIDSSQVIALLDKAQVPIGPIYSVADMFKDPHFRARGLFEEFTVNDKPLTIPAMVPRLSETPGHTEWTGPAIGSHNEEVFAQLLNLDESAQAELARTGVI
ncbi:MAG TPA: CoA transferase, partial [Spongiibacteraceae bacterium]|nr:CoA transferase [Spongiibacteraceae bacterium]